MDIPLFDIPHDFMAGDSITGDILRLYGMYPCKIKSGILVLCVKGSIKSNINLSEYVIKQHDFVFLPPDSFIQIHDMSEDICLYFAGFSSNLTKQKDIMDVMFNAHTIVHEKPVIHLPESVFTIYKDAFSLLKTIADNRQFVLTPFMVKNIVSVFLEGITELYQRLYKTPPVFSMKDNRLYNEFIQLVKQNYTKEHSVSFYARTMNISSSHLCSIVKQQGDKTPLEIIDAIIVMDAKAQLKALDIPVKDIAFMLGFTNTAFFHKYFRKHTGMTPLEYRND